MRRDGKNEGAQQGKCYRISSSITRPAIEHPRRKEVFTLDTTQKDYLYCVTGGKSCLHCMQHRLKQLTTKIKLKKTTMNYKKIMIATAAIMTIGAVTFVSCNKDSNEANKNNEVSGTKSGISMSPGQLHNEMLANAIDRFDETIDFNDVYEIVEYVKDINMTYIDEHDFDKETKEILYEMFEVTKECVSTPDLYDSTFAGQYSFDRNVNILYDAELIDDFDKEQLMSIWEQIVKAYNQESSNEEVIETIKKNATIGMEGTKSMVANAIYDIALSSIDFWNEYGDKPISIDPETPPCYLPPQVAADVIGATYSAAVCAIGQAALTGHVSGASVAVAAVGGAVNGSFGVAAKAANATVKAAKAVGKFIHKLVK